MYKVIISGGGTGGHIYPAIAIADELRRQIPSAAILFVGAEGRMEMEKVPAAGYPIIGLPVMGLQRAWTWKNGLLPFKALKSLRKAAHIIKEFRPNVVVGVGGYASGPTLWVAQRRKIPTLLQEQNSYAGITNKLLAKRADRICVAYDGMERFFPKEKIRLTGNPVRFAGGPSSPTGRTTAAAAFDLSPNKPTVLVVGGSLGARTLNRTMMQALPTLAAGSVQFIWQTGKPYFAEAQTALTTIGHPKTIRAMAFIDRIDDAFAAADVVISRAGAGIISELCVAGKACVFVPSPNVAEDHQTKNAQALVKNTAALMVADADAETSLLPTVLALLQDPTHIDALRRQATALAKPNAAHEIVTEILALTDSLATRPDRHE
ncbi:MAG: undecaprenyldiphospho-muramoylpentapeptide beta-N-acetylglucosaminyltransferase [Prevotellaceae bacterium]|jgi:UDP-N-acetylglucosamine--N-acetylmuramyl-(pentapeptide) pyrophosphoryl-undecaprenol N-acetylglucosamine transferase|nr:undecaprenyldiphospho-muramoylpentapeptide beta-N-acetylglucosaminyltransferase [Prevotellaceae bacterium]